MFTIMKKDHWMATYMVKRVDEVQNLGTLIADAGLSVKYYYCTPLLVGEGITAFLSVTAPMHQQIELFDRLLKEHKVNAILLDNEAWRLGG